jgi:hypothetical protein
MAKHLVCAAGAVAAIVVFSAAYAAEARDPKNASEALAGTWEGTVHLTKSFARNRDLIDMPVKLALDGKWAETSGSVSSFTIESGKMRTFNLKRRTVDFDVFYKLDGKLYAWTFKASFSEDWTVLTGTCTNRAVGEGPFELRLAR